MIAPTDLDSLMHRGWPSLSTVDVEGWIVRIAGGVTQRANSVLPVHSPADVARALERVERLYRDHGLSPTFQISPAAQPAHLDRILAGRGYRSMSPTLVQVAPVESALRRLSAPDIPIRIDEFPDRHWMRLWWAIDGRGGPGAEAVARRILIACPALYASADDRTGIAAIGRLALVDDWCGIYCMAVRTDVRRRGYATAVLASLLQEAANRAIQYAWLQVVAQNEQARTLYERAGFSNASRYHYRSLASR